MALPVGCKVLLDTNIFIDYLRSGKHSEWVLGYRGYVTRFLSSVVLMELRLGADTLSRKRAIDKIKAAFPGTRIVAPPSTLFDSAGDLFRKLYSKGSEPFDRLGTINDLLIALTARHIGAALVTSNSREFERIAAAVKGLVVCPPEVV